MTKYRKRPVVIEAIQWWKNGDHPLDACVYLDPEDGGDSFQGEGKVVRYYRTPNLDAKKPCKQCGYTMHWHGWIDTLEGGHIVCPGDWIITGVFDEHYPCKPDIFEATYEEV